MNKSYLLLRSNKQTGPYSLQELLQLKPTAKDLVWVEGLSAGWQYPFEMDELKDTVQVPFTDKSTPFATSLLKEVPLLETAAYKEASKKIFVSLPAKTKQPAPVEIKPSLEEKAAAIRERALSYTSQTEGATEFTEVKYVRSLSDIKEEYVDWLHQKKKKKRLSLKSPAAYAFLFLTAAAIAFFILQSKPRQHVLLETQAVANSRQTPITVSTTDPQKQNAPIEELEANNKVIPVASNNKALVTAREKLPPPVAVPGIKIQSKQLTQTVGKEEVPIIAREGSDAIQVSSKVSPQPSERSSEPAISELLKSSSQYIKTTEGIGLAISLENKSQQTIRMAAIDVLYFDKAKAQVAKQTVYFSTILPGETNTKNSSYLKAASASYRIGLVSSEKSGLYVMQ